MKLLKLSTLCFLLLITGSCKPGMSIQSQTMTMVFPENSNEIHIHYLFEGISVQNEKQETYNRAVKQLSSLSQKANNMFINIPKIDPRIVEFGNIRFFKDRTRVRPLCAERRVIISDKIKLAKQINESLRVYHKTYTKPVIMTTSDEELLKAFHKNKTQLGAMPLQANSLEGIVLSAVSSAALLYDDESFLKLMKYLKEDEQNFINFDRGAIGVKIPTSKAFSEKLTAPEFKKEWLKNSRKILNYIDVVPYEEGIEIIIGQEDTPIQFTKTGSNTYSRIYEKKFAIYAGTHGAVLKSKKNIRGSQLIKSFLVASKTGDHTKIFDLDADILQETEIFGEGNEPEEIKASGNLKSIIKIDIKTTDNGTITYSLLGQDYTMKELKKFIPTLSKVMNPKAKVSILIDDKTTFKSVNDLKKVFTDAGFEKVSVDSK